MSEYTLVIEAPCAWISSNDRTHHMAKAHLTKQWRAAVLWPAFKAGVPRIGAPVEITALVHKTRKGRYDAANLYPTIKAVVDGLVKHPVHGGADVLADDDNAHVTGITIRAGEIRDRAALTLIITTQEGTP